jgi:hypothetical protein
VGRPAFSVLRNSGKRSQVTQAILSPGFAEWRLKLEAYFVPADPRLSGRTPKNPHMNQEDLYVERMGSPD